MGRSKARLRPAPHTRGGQGKPADRLQWTHAHAHRSKIISQFRCNNTLYTTNAHPGALARRMYHTRRAEACNILLSSCSSLRDHACTTPAVGARRPCRPHRSSRVAPLRSLLATAGAGCQGLIVPRPEMEEAGPLALVSSSRRNQRLPPPRRPLRHCAQRPLSSLGLAARSAASRTVFT
jgi:hypothetical protein